MGAVFDIENSSFEEYYDHYGLDRKFGNVASQNRAAHLPYHNTAHHMAVVKVAYLLFQDALVMKVFPFEDLQEQTVDDALAALINAALLHDFGHSGLPDSEVDNISYAVQHAALAEYEPSFESIPRRNEFVAFVGALIKATRFGPHGHDPIEAASYEGTTWSFGLYAALAGMLRDADVGSVLLPESIRQVMEGLPRELFLAHREQALPSPEEWLTKNGKFLRSYSPHTVSGERFFNSRLPGALADMRRYIDNDNYSAQYRLESLEGQLHLTERHPDYDYTETESGRKSDSIPPDGYGWVANPYKRFYRADYTDTEYWMRLKYHKRFEVRSLEHIRNAGSLGQSLRGLADWLKMLFSDRVIEGGFGSFDRFCHHHVAQGSADVFDPPEGRFSGHLVYTGPELEELGENQPFLLQPHGHGFGLLYLNLPDLHILVNLNSPDKQAWYRVKRDDGLMHLQLWQVWSSYINLPISCEGITRSLIPTMKSR